MSVKIIAATDFGVLTLNQDNGNWTEDTSSMQDSSFTSIATSANGSILAGTRQGLYLSADGGRNWMDANQGLSQLHIRSVAFHPDDQSLAYVGTEPAAIFFSKDGGKSWKESLEVAKLRDQNRWYLPYSPEAGCIRGFAFSNSRGYAAVEVGGMLISDNFGENWQLTQDQNNLYPGSGLIHADVHRVFIKPDFPNHVIAPTGGGFFISTNMGQEWNLIHRAYSRSVWMDPNNPDHFILGPADGPDRNGRIEWTSDGGKNWETFIDGLETPWPRTMVEHFNQVEDQLFAVLSNGRLIFSSLDHISWKTALPENKKVRAIAVLAEN